MFPLKTNILLFLMNWTTTHNRGFARIFLFVCLFVCFYFGNILNLWIWIWISHLPKKCKIIISFLLEIDDLALLWK